MVRPGPVALNSDLPRLRRDLQQILLAAASAVDPRPIVDQALRRLPATSSRLRVVAAGKAAWSMAAGLHAVADRLVDGLVAGPAREGLALPPGLAHFRSGHPVPNAESERAGRLALRMAAASREHDTLLVLLSGGASAMLAVPAPGISLDAKGESALALMRAGVAIDGLNCVRKHLSAIKGGCLAAAAVHTITFAISDVHGPPREDDPVVIGSGPTVPDPTTFAEACDVIGRSRAPVPREVLAYLEKGAAGGLEETPKPGDGRLARSEYHLLANRHTATGGAAAAARGLGYAVDVIMPATHGEARDAARAFVAEALERVARARGKGSRRPACVIASGETTVTVRGDGRGGRNQEFALAAARALDDAACSGVFAILGSAGTDGIDGPTPAAGGIVDWTTFARATSLGFSLDAMLGRNASYEVFRGLDDFINWGPTGTNVGDIHVLLIAD